jgi:CheY-like chemotaxis protein
MPAGGSLEIATKKVSVDLALARANPGVQPGPYVRISVTDSGMGIPLSIQEKIFDPFFTTKASGKGTGLGLSTVAGIMKSHGGFVEVESEEGRGATFHLFFPALAPEPPGAGRDHPLTKVQGGGETILLIDDEPMVRDTLKLLLQRASYRVIAAEDGAVGLAEFERHHEAIALVISDMMLPGMSGMDVIKELRRRAPKLPAIAISGMMASGAYDDLLRLQPRVQCLAKPLAPSVLFAAVRGALRVV